MRQLQSHRHRRRACAHDRQAFAYGCFASVVVEAEAAVGDAADRRHRGGLDGEHARARLEELTPVDDVPVGGAAIDGRVLAHRRHDDPIGEHKFAQLEGREQGFGHGEETSSAGSLAAAICLEYRG